MIHLTGEALTFDCDGIDDKGVVPSKVEQLCVVLDLVIFDYVLFVFECRILLVFPNVATIKSVADLPLLFELRFGKIRVVVSHLCINLNKLNNRAINQSMNYF